MPTAEPRLHRRELLAWTGTGLLGACATSTGAAATGATIRRRGDLHVHLFGVAYGGSQCFLGPRIRRSATFALRV
jgi:hypothetical protein